MSNRDSDTRVIKQHIRHSLSPIVQCVNNYICDTPGCGPSAGLCSKYIPSQKKGGSTYNLLKEYVLFSNSFCTQVTDSEISYGTALVWERILYLYERGDVGGRSRSSSRMTPTITMPPDSRQILAVCNSRLTRNGGGGTVGLTC